MKDKGPEENPVTDSITSFFGLKCEKLNPVPEPDLEILAA